MGNLPRAVIERIVRQRFARMRACYEAGLRENPALAGRVIIRFVIGQEGEVLSSMDGGSDIADRSVVACAIVAIRTAVFPSPASGFVTVSFPILFRPAGAPALVAYAPPAPSAVHRAGDESWLTKGEDVLQKLRADVEKNPDSRRKHEDLVRGLLARGRFEEALAAAHRFVELDPDLAVARELLAYAAVTRDDPALAVLSIDTQTETDPASLKWHVRGARAFEAMGDERRACAHWRSLAELAPQSDEYAYESLRCRARVLGDLDAALADARRAPKSGKLLVSLLPALEGGLSPAFAKTSAGAGQLEATVTCSSGERCPTVFIVSPIGNVFSPFTPTDSRSSLGSVAVAGLRDGTYTTLLSGGSPDARGSVELRAFGSLKTLAFARGDRQTVATTRITLPDASAHLMAMRGDGFLLLR
jgi:tetratricopeptide (TPR) repeat protein